MVPLATHRGESGRQPDLLGCLMRISRPEEGTDDADDNAAPA
jgi:hypothetical protein